MEKEKIKSYRVEKLESMRQDQCEEGQLPELHFWVQCMIGSLVPSLWIYASHPTDGLAHGEHVEDDHSRQSSSISHPDLQIWRKAGGDTTRGKDVTVNSPYVEYSWPTETHPYLYLGLEDSVTLQ